jgi:hypothetical protein
LNKCSTSRIESRRQGGRQRIIRGGAEYVIVAKKYVTHWHFLRHVCSCHESPAICFSNIKHICDAKNRTMTTQNMTYVPNWDFMSHHESTGIALSSLLGCCLVVGDFIQFKEGEAICVGRIHTINGLNAQVNCWMFVNNLLPEEQAMVGTINANTHRSVMGMEEVVQTNCFVDIDIAVDVVGHAFVFHFDSIQDARHPVNGISDAFATRFRLNKISYDVPGDVTSFSDMDHKPFSNGCHSSSGEILYDGLMLVVSLMREILYTKRQFQPFRNSKKTVLPRAVWEYICHKLVNIVTCSTKERSRVRRQFFQNLALNKTHETHLISSLVVNSIDGFDAIRSIFGRTFGLGVRKNFSDINGVGDACLTLGDIVNAVGFSVLKDYTYSTTANNDRSDVFNGLLDRPNGNEITMRYDGTTKLYTLTVAFCRIVVRGDSDESKALIGHIDNTIYQEMFGIVSVGERFLIGHKTYVVLKKMADGTYDCARQRYGDVQVDRTKNYTHNQIRDYIDAMNI